MTSIRPERAITSRIPARALSSRAPILGRWEEVTALDEDRGSAFEEHDRFEAEQLVIVELVLATLGDLEEPVDAFTDDPVALLTRRGVDRFALPARTGLRVGRAQPLSQLTGIAEEPPDPADDPPAVIGRGPAIPVIGLCIGEHCRDLPWDGPVGSSIAGSSSSWPLLYEDHGRRWS